MKAIHVEAPPDAPTNPFRSVPLSARDEAFQRRLLRLDAEMPDLLDIDAVQGCWQEAVDAPIDSPRVWIHGDLHPRNVISTQDGRLAGIIDWGDAAAGDTATDLAAAWMHFAPEHVDEVFTAYGPVSHATRVRAKGAALALAMAFALVDDPLADAARRTFQHLGVASRS